MASRWLLLAVVPIGVALWWRYSGAAVSTVVGMMICLGAGYVGGARPIQNRMPAVPGSLVLGSRLGSRSSCGNQNESSLVSRLNAALALLCDLLPPNVLADLLAQHTAEHADAAVDAAPELTRCTYGCLQRRPSALHQQQLSPSVRTDLGSSSSFSVDSYDHILSSASEGDGLWYAGTATAAAAAADASAAPSSTTDATDHLINPLLLQALSAAVPAETCDNPSAPVDVQQQAANFREPGTAPSRATLSAAQSAPAAVDAGMARSTSDGDNSLAPLRGEHSSGSSGLGALTHQPSLLVVAYPVTPETADTNCTSAAALSRQLQPQPYAAAPVAADAPSRAVSSQDAGARHTPAAGGLRRVRTVAAGLHTMTGGGAPVAAGSQRGMVPVGAASSSGAALGTQSSGMLSQLLSRALSSTLSASRGWMRQNSDALSPPTSGNLNDSGYDYGQEMYCGGTSADVSASGAAAAAHAAAGGAIALHGEGLLRRNARSLRRSAEPILHSNHSPDGDAAGPMAPCTSDTMTLARSMPPPSDCLPALPRIFLRSRSSALPACDSCGTGSSEAENEHGKVAAQQSALSRSVSPAGSCWGLVQVGSSGGVTQAGVAGAARHRRWESHGGVVGSARTGHLAAAGLAVTMPAAAMPDGLRQPAGGGGLGDSAHDLGSHVSRRLHRASTGCPSVMGAAGFAGLQDGGCSTPDAGTPRTPGGYGNSSGSVRDMPYAEWHPCVSVLFADVCGFTSISDRVPAVAVMEMLNALYCRLDALCANWGQHAGASSSSFGHQQQPPPVYKVQIIGDAYMVATGLLADDPAHAATACCFALAVQREAAQVLDPCDGQPLRLRVGIHSGPVVSGVVGRMRRQYSVFGDTVNVASRMESTGAPGAIHVSEDTHRLALPYMPPGSCVWRRRTGVEVKGKGTMDTYWLEEAPAPVPALQLQQQQLQQQMTTAGHVRSPARSPAHTPPAHTPTRLSLQSAPSSPYTPPTAPAVQEATDLDALLPQLPPPLRPSLEKALPPLPAVLEPVPEVDLSARAVA